MILALSVRRLWGAIVLGCAVWTAQGIDLAKSAPELAPSEWLQNGPVSLAELKDKATTVVLFYDSFNPLTRPALLRLSGELKKHGAEAVRIVTVSVEEPDTVKKSEYWPLLNEFAVATDDGKFAETYLGGREQSPLAFIVDKNGQIAWIGSPLVIEEPLEQVVQGDYDLSQIAAVQNNREQVEEYLQNGNFADAVAMIDRMLEKEPGEASLIGLKVRILSVLLKRPEEGLAFLKQQIEKYPGNYTLQLFLIANYRELGNLTQEEASYRELAVNFKTYPSWLRQEAESILLLSMEKMSLRSALVLAEAAWNSPELRDRNEKAQTAQTLAKIYYMVGRADLATKMQNNALELFPPSTPESSKALVLLKYYESALDVGSKLK